MGVAITVSVCAFATMIWATTLNASTTYLENQTSTDRQSLCIELGLTPEALAALGVQGYQVSGIFDEIDERADLAAAMRSHQIQQISIVNQLKQARRASRLAADLEEELQIQLQIDQLTSELSTLHQSIDQAQLQLRLAILPAGIAAQDIERVCEPADHAAKVPVEFRLADLRNQDYADIARALHEERRAQSNGQQPDTDTQLLLSGYRNLPAVSQARSNLLYNLDAVRAAFND